MLIIAFFIAAINLVLSTPVQPPSSGLDVADSVIIIGRELPPGCTNVAHYRTIQDIVWSCLATIFACTWVAVHPNVPNVQDSGWIKLRQKVLVMVYAFLTPEFIITWATRQRRGAAQNMKKYNEKFYPKCAYLEKLLNFP